MAPMKPRSVGVNLSEEEKEIWTKLAALNFQASRYPCSDAIYTMGLTTSWDALCTRGKLTHMFQDAQSSYRALTYEFLSTLKVHMNGREVVSMDFRFKNRELSLTVDQLNNIFQFHGSDVGITEEPEEYERDTFWRAITLSRASTEYRPARAKANEIRNPVLRYMQKAIAYLPFARFEVGSVQSDDLFLLWSLLYGQPLNMGHFLIRFLERQSKKTKGHICCGGIITSLAVTLDVDLSNNEPESGPKLITYEVLRQTKMLNVNDRGQGYFLQNAGDHFPLPDPQNTAVGGWTYRVNWQMNEEVHHQITRNNPPGRWGRSTDLPLREVHVQEAVLPEEPQQILAVPNVEEGNPAEEEHQAEGTSRGRRRKRIFDVERALDSMSQRIDDMQVTINEGFEAQRQADMQWRTEQNAQWAAYQAEQNAHWANYQADQQHNLQWQQRMENFWFSHYPPPPPPPQ